MTQAPTASLTLTPATSPAGGKDFASSVIYQVYPKSFYSAAGGAYGDLRGVIEKVPYIASLGVDMVWFNPFFAPPQNDNGYDISDYYAINPDLGTMKDVEEMIAALAKHGVGVMFDMVLNHVSTEHEWFQRALAGEREYGITSTFAPANTPRTVSCANRPTGSRSSAAPAGPALASTRVSTALPCSTCTCTTAPRQT